MLLACTYSAVIRAMRPSAFARRTSSSAVMDARALQVWPCSLGLDEGSQRWCFVALDRMRNDSPSEDCIARFGCYFNMCDKNGCVCPPGYNMSLDGLSCLTDTRK